MAEAKLPRSERVRTRTDFARAQRSGRRAAAGHVVVLQFRRPAPCDGTFESPNDRPRLGIVASRRIGCAVVRNRAKRCVREWFRRRKHELPRSVDLLVILKPGVAELRAAALGAELDAAVAELGGGAGGRRARPRHSG